MFSIDTVSASRIDPMTSVQGADLLRPLLFGRHADDDDPVDIDILDIWRQDEGVDDDEYFDEEADELAFLDECDDDDPSDD